MEATAQDQFATLARAARETARSMAAAAEGQDDAARVTIAAGQFRFIATMLAQLSDDAARCASSGCMGRPINGFRFWVPQGEVARLTAEVKHLRESLKFSGTLHY